MEDKRTAVLIMSRVFPKGHSRAGQPTEFAKHMADGSKITTIRGNYSWWAKKAELINSGKMELSVRQWSGQPYRSKQVEIARFSHIFIMPFSGSYGADDAEPKLYVGNMEANAAKIAANDGLSLEDWTEWFFKHENTFEGVIIYMRK